MIQDELSGWAPISFSWDADEPRVHWVRLDGERFHEPFFEDTIARLLKRPFNLLFTRKTSPGVLGQLLAARPGLRPAGLIFHGSRCGSTLVAQMLGAVTRSIVLSEVPALDTILRSRHRTPSIPDGARIDWLRGFVSALGQPRRPDEDRLFLKLDSWSVLELPTILQAFPGVPWVFLYREPLRVLSSHQRERGVHMVPGMIEPAAVGLDEAVVARSPHEEYCARVLAGFYDAAAAEVRRGGGRLVDYAELPDVLLTPGPGLFGLSWTPGERAAMEHAAGFDAKAPRLTFAAASAAGRAEPGPALRAASERWAEPAYRRLEALRGRR